MHDRIIEVQDETNLSKQLPSEVPMVNMRGFRDTTRLAILPTATFANGLAAELLA